MASKQDILNYLDVAFAAVDHAIRAYLLAEAIIERAMDGFSPEEQAELRAEYNRKRERANRVRAELGLEPLAPL